MGKKLKPWPDLKSEDEIDAFVQNADLSGYEWDSAFTMEQALARFEAGRKDSRVNLRLPAELIDAYKSMARKSGIPYQRLMRLELQKGLHAAMAETAEPGAAKQAKTARARKATAA